jgi:translation initiation factor 1
MSKMNEKGGLVYSTEFGRTCPVCRKALTACTCKAASAQAPVGDGKVRVSRQTKGRGGKCVTVVRGLALDGTQLAALGKQLRAVCGAGGTVKDGVIEVQGDHCEQMLEALKKMGHDARLAGG